MSIALPSLALTDITGVDDRVALGGEIVPSHVRYVLLFNRRPDQDELEVLQDLLSSVEVVREVTPEGIVVITSDRETPGRPITDIAATVARTTEETRNRADSIAERRRADVQRSADLREQLRRDLQTALAGTD